MSADDLSRTAAFFRDGIASGVIAPDAAIAWADAQIMARDDLPTAMYDLSVAPGRRTASVLDALGQLTDVNELTESTARALLDVLRTRLSGGTMSVYDAVVAAYHLTRALDPGSAIWTEALILEENYSLAKDGILGSGDEMDAEALSWFEQFRGGLSGFPTAAI